MFALTDVRHRYGDTTVLSIADWQVGQGEHWLVIGPSGSGKTTLLHLLAGVLRPQEGTVRVVGEDIGRFSQAELDRFRGRNIGIVLQRLHLIGSLSVARNLLLAQYCAGLAQEAARVDEVLGDLGMREKRNAHPHELSHGQAQRVALARAVINRPRLILADEPTSNLDDANCEQALELLRGQAQRCEATLVIATHDARLKSRFERQLSLAPSA
jgi:putative ABC transport system ATP-binding protein